ncbi:hypothetical protein HDG34_005845 [Paraburkholderia sp. HC6.4b]|uniref:DNA-binding protein n=1 Tax=unclassified Paraburkholderia TaxID=2615204 RepID=UPI00160BDA60|nr:MULTISPECIES: DNA-binding protein [unclassified Paraburkholderia]MBB5411879.1 hypothetical protein [Paraburkholderia sp. HC6.4b]MBB5450191.1 hypothetical protein [Paraburkholderia sp. Kb1A]
MNEVVLMRRPSLELAIREAIADPDKRQRILVATGWDESMLSKIVAKQPAGITLDKFDALLGAIDYVYMSAKYANAVCTLGEVGMFCKCMRAGMGECGPSR